MIKNDANKCAKQIETKVPVTTTAQSSLRQQSSDVDNRQTHTTIQRSTANKYNEVDDNDSAKPLSKLDLIKKFDSKYKASESVDNKQSHRSSYEESQKFNTVPDEVENDENIQNSNSEEVHDVEITSRFSDTESSTVANNNHNNGNTYGANANANGNETIPPKPLPRTSRNNSVSSLSSEHSISIANPIEESGRPVAKPRTTTTSYKVQHLTNFYTCFAHVSCYFLGFFHAMVLSFKLDFGFILFSVLC